MADDENENDWGDGDDLYASDAEDEGQATAGYWLMDQHVAAVLVPEGLIMLAGDYSPGVAPPPDLMMFSAARRACASLAQVDQDLGTLQIALHRLTDSAEGLREQPGVQEWCAGASLPRDQNLARMQDRLGDAMQWLLDVQRDGQISADLPRRRMWMFCFARLLWLGVLPDPEPLQIMFLRAGVDVPATSGDMFKLPEELLQMDSELLQRNIELREEHWQPDAGESAEEEQLLLLAAIELLLTPNRMPGGQAARSWMLEQLQRPERSFQESMLEARSLQELLNAKDGPPVSTKYDKDLNRSSALKLLQLLLDLATRKPAAPAQPSAARATRLLDVQLAALSCVLKLPFMLGCNHYGQAGAQSLLRHPDLLAALAHLLRIAHLNRDPARHDAGEIFLAQQQHAVRLEQAAVEATRFFASEQAGATHPCEHAIFARQQHSQACEDGERQFCKCFVFRACADKQRRFCERAFPVMEIVMMHRHEPREGSETDWMVADSQETSDLRLLEPSDETQRLMEKHLQNAERQSRVMPQGENAVTRQLIAAQRRALSMLMHFLGAAAHRTVPVFSTAVRERRERKALAKALVEAGGLSLLKVARAAPGELRELSHYASAEVAAELAERMPMGELQASTRSALLDADVDAEEVGAAMRAMPPSALRVLSENCVDLVESHALACRLLYWLSETRSFRSSTSQRQATGLLSLVGLSQRLSFSPSESAYLRVIGLGLLANLAEEERNRDAVLGGEWGDTETLLLDVVTVRLPANAPNEVVGLINEGRQHAALAINRLDKPLSTKEDLLCTVFTTEPLTWLKLCFVHWFFVLAFGGAAYPWTRVLLVSTLGAALVGAFALLAEEAKISVSPMPIVRKTSARSAAMYFTFRLAFANAIAAWPSAMLGPPPQHYGGATERALEDSVFLGMQWGVALLRMFRGLHAVAHHVQPTLPKNTLSFAAQNPEAICFTIVKEMMIFALSCWVVELFFQRRRLWRFAKDLAALRKAPLLCLLSMALAETAGVVQAYEAHRLLAKHSLSFLVCLPFTLETGLGQACATAMDAPPFGWGDTLSVGQLTGTLTSAPAVGAPDDSASQVFWPTAMLTCVIAATHIAGTSYFTDNQTTNIGIILSPFVSFTTISFFERDLLGKLALGLMPLQSWSSSRIRATAALLRLLLQDKRYAAVLACHLLAAVLSTVLDLKVVNIGGQWAVVRELGIMGRPSKGQRVSRALKVLCRVLRWFCAAIVLNKLVWVALLYSNPQLGAAGAAGVRIGASSGGRFEPYVQSNEVDIWLDTISDYKQLQTSSSETWVAKRLGLEFFANGRSWPTASLLFVSLLEGSTAALGNIHYEGSEVRWWHAQRPVLRRGVTDTANPAEAFKQRAMAACGKPVCAKTMSITRNTYRALSIDELALLESMSSEAQRTHFANVPDPVQAVLAAMLERKAKLWSKAAQDWPQVRTVRGYDRPTNKLWQRTDRPPWNTVCAKNFAGLGAFLRFAEKLGRSELVREGDQGWTVGKYAGDAMEGSKAWLVVRLLAWPLKLFNSMFSDGRMDEELVGSTVVRLGANGTRAVVAPRQWWRLQEAQVNASASSWATPTSKASCYDNCSIMENGGMIGCTDPGEEYETLASAKAECDAAGIAACNGVFDRSCDGGKFHLCTAGIPWLPGGCARAYRKKIHSPPMIGQTHTQLWSTGGFWILSYSLLLGAASALLPVIYELYNIPLDESTAGRDRLLLALTVALLFSLCLRLARAISVRRRKAAEVERFRQVPNDNGFVRFQLRLQLRNMEASGEKDAGDDDAPPSLFSGMENRADAWRRFSVRPERAQVPSSLRECISSPGSAACRALAELLADGVERRALASQDVLEEDVVCGICFSGFESGDYHAVLTCSNRCRQQHHKRCLSQWMKRSQTCPLCRSPVSAAGGSIRSALVLPAALHRQQRWLPAELLLLLHFASVNFGAAAKLLHWNWRLHPKLLALYIALTVQLPNLLRSFTDPIIAELWCLIAASYVVLGAPFLRHIPLLFMSNFVLSIHSVFICLGCWRFSVTTVRQSGAQNALKSAALHLLTSSSPDAAFAFKEREKQAAENAGRWLNQMWELQQRAAQELPGVLEIIRDIEAATDEALATNEALEGLEALAEYRDQARQAFSEVERYTEIIDRDLDNLEPRTDMRGRAVHGGEPQPELAESWGYTIGPESDGNITEADPSVVNVMRPRLFMLLSNRRGCALSTVQAANVHASVISESWIGAILQRASFPRIDGAALAYLEKVASDEGEGQLLLCRRHPEPHPPQVEGQPLLHGCVPVTWGFEQTEALLELLDEGADVCFVLTKWLVLATPPDADEGTLIGQYFSHQRDLETLALQLLEMLPDSAFDAFAQAFIAEAVGLLEFLSERATKIDGELELLSQVQTAVDAAMIGAAGAVSVAEL